MADAKVSLQKLNDQNYAIWKFKIELLLMTEGLTSVVTDPKPEGAAATADVLAEWSKKDGKARAMIGLAVEDSQLVHIIRKQTAKGMWDSLKQIHEATSLSSTLHILRKLCSLRLSEEGDLLEHLNEMTDLQNRLEVIGEGLKDRVFMALILSSLPLSYGSLINVIENKPEDECTVDFVKSKLRDEWRRRLECNNGGVHSDEKVMQVVQCTKKPTEKKKKSVCYYCQEEGHFRRECPKLAKERQEMKSEDGKANLAAEVPDGMEMCLMAVTTCSANRWYLDSGATSHMASDAGLLTNVILAKQPEICLADGNTVKSCGVGSGKLVSVTGRGERLDLTLNDVCHVPSLSGNVLAVSRICDLGYDVLFDRAGCRVLQGQEGVCLGERSDGLYHLKQEVEPPDLCEHLRHRKFIHPGEEPVTLMSSEEQSESLKTTSAKDTGWMEESLESSGRQSPRSAPRYADTGKDIAPDPDGGGSEALSSLDATSDGSSCEEEPLFHRFPLDDPGENAERSMRLSKEPTRLNEKFLVVGGLAGGNR